MQELWVQSLGWEDPLEKEMATHLSILAWHILWTEKPEQLHSTGLQRIRHNLVTEHVCLFLINQYDVIWSYSETLLKMVNICEHHGIGSSHSGSPSASTFFLCGPR